MPLQDWGVSYEELEPYYDKFEYLCGVSGKAGNLQGQKIDGGNVFEGPRQREYPNPPMLRPTRELCSKRRRKILATIRSRSGRKHVAALHQSRRRCLRRVPLLRLLRAFRLRSERQGQPAFHGDSAARRRTTSRCAPTPRHEGQPRPRKEARRERDLHRPAGREFEQPAGLVVLPAYALGNVHLMLLSGIGKPYDPATGKGVVGRNYAYQIGSGATVFFDETTWINPFMGAGALAVNIDDFNTGSFDHAKEGFIGGGGISTPSSGGGRPIGFRPVPPGTPAWGTEWKQAVVRHYNHTITIGNQGSVMAYRQNYLDLDPSYRIATGDR